jgi:hypothetical protein
MLSDVNWELQVACEALAIITTIMQPRPELAAEGTSHLSTFAPPHTNAHIQRCKGHSYTRKRRVPAYASMKARPASVGALRRRRQGKKEQG